MIDGQPELVCSKCGKNDWCVTGSNHTNGNAVLLICKCGNKARLVPAGDDYESCIIEEGACRWEWERVNKNDEENSEV